MKRNTGDLFQFDFRVVEEVTSPRRIQGITASRTRNLVYYRNSATKFSEEPKGSIADLYGARSSPPQ